MITLRAGSWMATVSPELGGAILRLDHAGAAVLRPTPDGTDEVLQTACFPLVPYVNRIADARFSHGGCDVTLPTLAQFAPHALHGDGWLRAWSVDTVEAARVVLRLEGGEDHWPWAWTAIQTIELTDDGLRIDLSMTNRARTDAPAGLGLHPYFVRGGDTRLSFRADAVWLADAREIPERLAPADAVMDWSGGPKVSDAPFVDHAYAGWDGQAVLGDGDRRIVMIASDNCRWAQVYAPTGQDFVCVEPMSHRPDAVHAPAGEDAGLAVLKPGETLSIWMRVGIEG